MYQSVSNMGKISVLNAEYRSLKNKGDSYVMQCINMRIRCTVKVALRPHSAKKIFTYCPAYFDELRYILPHCSIYSYYNSYLDF